MLSQKRAPSLSPNCKVWLTRQDTLYLLRIDLQEKKTDMISQNFS
uniref:Uncharacterized protein n=1 Tax=Arundo donax TaxID=35708 RepID=A0A0A9MKS3_ARUDO